MGLRAGIWEVLSESPSLRVTTRTGKLSRSATMACLLLRLTEEDSIVCGYQSLVEMYHVSLLSKN